MIKNKLITKAEAQKYLGVGNNTMYNLLQKEGFGFKIGNKWYCNEKKMLEWMDKQVYA